LFNPSATVVLALSDTILVSLITFFGANGSTVGHKWVTASGGMRRCESDEHCGFPPRVGAEARREMAVFELASWFGLPPDTQ
jgi:hypothetical protein